LLSIVSKNNSEKSIFAKYVNGVNTARDEWVFGFDSVILSNKCSHFIKEYNDSILKDEFNENNNNFKWSRDLKLKFKRKLQLPKFDSSLIISTEYRPYTKVFHYAEKMLNDVLTSNHYDTLGKELKKENILINILGGSASKSFQALSTNRLTTFQFFSDPSFFLPAYFYDLSGNRIDNITNWGHEQFSSHYNDQSLTKEDIFHYTYAVLHNPAYRKKYELNLKREFPRIPFYEDFWKWAGWGKTLMDLHINYETVEPYPLEEHNYELKAEAKRQKEMFTIAEEPEPMFAKKPKVKAKLKADKQAGIIEIDELTFLTGVPREAWEYKLGNRCALEWILDQYKEKKPKDPTIAEKFNTYRFADYKDKVIDLLKRVCRVSLETVKVVRGMEKEK
jgi:predicted helicase